MSNLATKLDFFSVEDYLSFEEKPKIRHEYMDGEIYSMARASRIHNLATVNISRVLEAV